jgi:hypothetical protein
MALSTLRSDLKTAIASNNKYNIYDHVPEAIIPPAVMIAGGSPWLEPIVIGNNKAFSVRYIIECVSQPISNPGSLATLEDLVETVLGLIPVKWIIRDISAPRIRPVGSTDLLAAEILIQTTYNP